MTLESWIAFALMNLAYSAPPGPNAAILLAVSSRGGLRHGVAAFGGILMAEVFWAGLALLIVSGVLDIGALMPGLLEIIGAAALILLGLPMLIRRALSPAPAQETPAKGDLKGTRGIAAAFFVGVTNPLAMVFFVSVAPMFLTTGSMTPLAAVLFVSAAVLSCACAHAPYLGIAGIITPRLTAIIERGCGGLFVCMGAIRLAEHLV